MMEGVKKNDQELYKIMKSELDRQKNTIEMIASESTVPTGVLELSGSVFTNKTLEGYPGARFQSGAGPADEMERLGVERLKVLYGADHANIQPISGSTANYSVYAAILNPGDTVLAMSLDQGGHLTHGSDANTMSNFYNFIHYGLDPERETIDYDNMEKLAIKHKPKLIISGGSSYSRTIDYKRIYEISKKVDAYTMADIAHISGLIAADILPNPIPYTDFVTSSTTKTIGGPRGGMIMCKEKFAKKIDRGVFPRTMGSIHVNIMAAKAYTFKIASSEAFKKTMEQVVKNSIKLSESLKEHGFRIVSDGTDNHIVMVDLKPIGIKGNELQHALDSIGITVNKNMIPFDSEKPSVTSGIRIGTTAISQRGLKEDEVETIAEIINDIARNHDNEDILSRNRKKVQQLIKNFPLYDDEINY